IIMENQPPEHNEFALAAEAAPNNNNRWIEWDVPLGGETKVDPEFDEMDDYDDDDHVWDENDEWLISPVTTLRATVTVSSTYEMDNLEHRNEVLMRKMEEVSDVEVDDSITIRKIQPRVATMEEQNLLYSYTKLLVSVSDLVLLGAAPVARAPYCLAPSEMKEFSDQLKELSKKDSFAQAHRPRELRQEPISTPKERQKPLRVRALVMLVYTDLSERILQAQTEAMNKQNVTARNLGRLLKLIFEICLMGSDTGCLYRLYRMEKLTHQKALGTNVDMSTAYHPETYGQIEFSYNNSYHMSIKAAPLKHSTGESVDRQIVRVRPLKVIDRISPVAYKLEQLDKLRGIYNTFHVSNLKKCIVDENQVISLEEIQLDDKLHFIKEPVEIIDREVKQLK
nr:reverse transcriptase domain-containing protein [Tanacetum cinerariifolium]